MGSRDGSSGDGGPAGELCNGVDDDGDGLVDEGCGCAVGDTQECYPGDPMHAGVGTCLLGRQTCIESGIEFGAWGACTGAEPPSDELCDGRDNDCDGTVDDGCDCEAGATESCYDGPAGTADIGICRSGTRACEDGAGGVGRSWGACEGSVLPRTEACNGIDDDCNGAVDEGCECSEGAVRSCYTGPAGTAGVGPCSAGMQRCALGSDGRPTWGACEGDVLPGDDVCNGLDDDCDGTPDDGCRCPPGAMRACWTGDPALRGVGLCRDGRQTCELGAGGAGSDWGTCTGERLPAAELCNGTDDDCDGMLDEGCSCTPGDSRTCYSGPPGTAGVAACRAGRQSCVLSSDGSSSSWGACTGEVLPSTDVCFDSIDNDCDGVVDDACLCRAGETRACYSGAPATRGVGICRDGSARCVVAADMTSSDFGACSGSTLPAAAELCNGLDDDCDGTTDEGCSCTPRSTRACYTGPAGTDGVGACRAGTQTCDLSPDGTSSSWGACSGMVLPAAEVCNGADDDCDGTVDDGCTCIPGEVRACYDGPPGTRRVGLCRDGTQRCNAGPGGVGSSWGACGGWVGPSTETCDGADNDCDGMLDETCVCTPGSTRGCYSGPPATRMVGLCRDGSQTCVVSGGVAMWGSCTGEVLPRTETCDMRDEDCDGITDDGACMMPPTAICPGDLFTTPLVPVTLNGAGTDPDGVIASWRWTLISAPPGASGSFSCATCMSTQFTPNLVGVYTIQLTVTDNSGLMSSCTFTVTARGNGLRVEVTWNTNFSDVDTHLLRRAGGTGWFNTPNDCYYANPTPAWDAAGLLDDPRLDIDDVNGYGPENINVDVPVTGNSYRVGIHYYSDHGAGASAVTVRIYCGDISLTPVATYMRTLSRGAGLPDSNDFWRVADVRWDGGDACTVTAINTLTTGSVARTTP